MCSQFYLFPSNLDFFPVVGRGLLIVVASLAAEHGVSVWASVAVAHEL